MPRSRRRAETWFLQETDSGFCHRQCLYFIHVTIKKSKLTFKKDLEWNSISKTTWMLFMYLALLQAKTGGLWAKLRIPRRRGESSGSLAEARRFESGEERLVLRSHKGFCFWWGWVNIKWMDRYGISIIYIDIHAYNLIQYMYCIYISVYIYDQLLIEEVVYSSDDLRLPRK